jgi:Sulfotransferase family
VAVRRHRVPDPAAQPASGLIQGPTVTQHEEELGEIRALAYEVAKSTHLVLKRIRQARGLLAPPGPLIAFVHIPKTAGGTVTSMFAAAYSKQALDRAGNFMRGPEKTHRKLTRRDGGWENWHRKGGRISVGHTPYGVFLAHLPADVRYMTFLREPVDRVVSHYYRHMHHPEMSAADRDKRRQGGRVAAASLEEALREHRPPQLCNLATRFLCGHESPMGALPPSALDDAKTNLREFAFVGIQERFEESIVLLQRMLGLELVPQVNRHVSTEGGRPAVDEIPAEQRALIEEHNRLDAELYAFGLGLFNEAVAGADEGFVTDVERLRASSASAQEEAIETARAWLERELPPGTAKTPHALRSAAKALGITMPALNEAVGRLPSVKTEFDGDGQKVLIRT